MGNATTVSGFQALYGHLMQVNFMKAAKPAFSARASADTIRALLAKGDPHLPTGFRSGYSTPLEQSLAAVMARLSPGGQLDTVTLETLTACVYQLGDSKLTPALHRFLAVISNLYRSFLDKAKRARLDVPLRETLPPLAAFQSDPADGPFTITYETVNQLFGGSLGVVSMPWTFADHPLLYGSLAHETGGHDVIHADSALMPELRQAVRAAFSGSDAWLGLLWDYWMDEAAADIYGVMNLGPGFGANLAMLLAVFIAQASGRKAGLAPVLRTETGADASGLDPHPTDILRLALVQGAVGTLGGLAQSTRAEYLQDLDQLAQALAAGASSVDINGTLRTADGKSLSLQRSVPLATMQDAARRAGALIATVRLQALAGHSVQDIETWDDADENAARNIAGRLASGSSITGAGDDAQILAGLNLAALAQPSAYAALSKLANAALDDSFASDPYWGVQPRDRLLIAPLVHRAQPEVHVDPYAEKLIDFNPLETDLLAAVSQHSISAIPWPTGKAPKIDSAFSYRGQDAELPQADAVLITWTSAEANAMSALMTPGMWAMPATHSSAPSWYVYANQWDSKFAGRSTGRAPAAQSHYIGKFMPVLIGGRRVLLFKSNFHMARDNRSLPVLDMFKQVIQQTGAKLVITTGTAGAIGTRLQLGDVVVANQARFKLDGSFKSSPFNGETFTSSYAPKATGSMKAVNSQLVKPNAAVLKNAPIPPKDAAPQVYLPGDEKPLGEPVTIVTTDSFEYDDARNTFKLQGLGAMVEMDDAVLGLACRQLGDGPQWLAIRNASDPQMPANATKSESSDIYLKYGYWTTIPSVLACWAAVIDF